MKKKKIKFYILSILVILIILAFTAYIGTYFVKFVSNQDLFEKWVNGHGIFGPIAYILIVIIQTIFCFIPGEPFEFIAGYAFGITKGFLLCLLAESIGGFIILFVTKKYGMKIVSLFFNDEKIKSLRILKTSKNRFLIYSLLYILPGTPKDLLCYYGGLTDYQIIPLMIVTSIGRIPSIITSVLGADAFGDKKYEMMIIIVGITIVISIIGLLIYRSIINKKETNNN